MLIEPDGSIRIAWAADGYEAIHVLARARPYAEHATYARRIADLALLERTLHDLRVALRTAFPGAFDLTTREPAGAPWRVVVTFLPPKGTPRPEP